jgi:hypothetical protein
VLSIECKHEAIHDHALITSREKSEAVERRFLASRTFLVDFKGEGVVRKGYE